MTDQPMPEFHFKSGVNQMRAILSPSGTIHFDGRGPRDGWVYGPGTLTRDQLAELAKLAGIIPAEPEGAGELATKAEAPDAPAYEPEPEGAELRRYRVKFFRHVTTADRHSIIVRASTAERADARVEAWGAGEIELTDEEAGTESLEKEMDIISSEFDELADDLWHATVPVDEIGNEIEEEAAADEEERVDAAMRRSDAKEAAIIANL